MGGTPSRAGQGRAVRSFGPERGGSGAAAMAPLEKAGARRAGRAGRAVGLSGDGRWLVCVVGGALSDVCEGRCGVGSATISEWWAIVRAGVGGARGGACGRAGPHQTHSPSVICVTCGFSKHTRLRTKICELVIIGDHLSDNQTISEWWATIRASIGSPHGGAHVRGFIKGTPSAVMYV